MRQSDNPPEDERNMVDNDSGRLYTRRDGAAFDPLLRRLPFGVAFGSRALTPNGATSMPNTLAAAKRSADVHCRMALQGRRDFVFTRADGSEAAIVGMMWTTPEGWRRHPYRRSREWLAVQIQPNMVVALRLDRS